MNRHEYFQSAKAVFLYRPRRENGARGAPTHDDDVSLLVSRAGHRFSFGRAPEQHPHRPPGQRQVTSRPRDSRARVLEVVKPGDLQNQNGYRDGLGHRSGRRQGRRLEFPAALTGFGGS